MLLPILVEKAHEYKLPLTTVVVEALHVILLDHIFSCPESRGLCFQGGTCIHLLHGGYRYSEDIDIAGNLNISTTQRIMQNIRVKVEKHVIQLLGTGICGWREPSSDKQRNIHIYWFHFQPTGKQQKYKVKIEFANYPVYSPTVMAIQSEFDVLHRRALISGLPPTELLAERITAVCGRSYMKGRDLFDLWYLTDVLNSSIDHELVRVKFNDYRVSAKIDNVKQRLENYPPAALAAEMNRFLPIRYRNQFDQQDYVLLRQRTMDIIESTFEHLE